MSSIPATTSLESLAINLTNYQQQCPDLFIDAIPTGYLYVLKNDLEKFTNYLEQYQRQLGEEALIFLLEQGLLYEGYLVGIIDACLSCGRAEMCLEINRYLPNYRFDLQKIYNTISSCYCRFLARKIDITLVCENVFVFQSKMLSYPIPVTHNSHNHQYMTYNLKYHSDPKIVGKCLPFLLRANRISYRLNDHQKSFFLGILNRAELDLLNQINGEFLDNLISTVIAIVSQQSKLIFSNIDNMM